MAHVCLNARTSCISSARTLSRFPRSRHPRRRLHDKRALASQTDTKPAHNPFSEVTTYNDTAFDRFFINFLNRKISQQVGVQLKQDGYDGFVEISKELMRNKTPVEQKAAVLAVLFSLLPSIIPWACKKFFVPNKITCFINAYMASIGFKWLVGDMELKQIEIEQPDGTVKLFTSQVVIKKCRYLEQSRCVGLCVNICKVPTQDFFTNDFGMPLYMEPNFEDLSCRMNFGQAPPPTAEDPVNTQPCFSACNLSKASSDKCYTLR